MHFLKDFLHFVSKQAYACLFGGFLIILMTITKYYYPLDGILYRYDFLFLAAVAFQGFLIYFKLEEWREVKVIALFHLVAMGMEIFKTHPSIGSWQYPEEFRIGIMNVPLFAGFMYSAVGSYIARVWRIFSFEYENYPKKWLTILVATLIYINFFSHHFIYDIRWWIILSLLFIYGKTLIYYKPNGRYYSMNLVLGFGLVSTVIWIGENIATYMNIWLYPYQVDGWHPVGTEKITAWFLLMIISFVLVSLIHTPKKHTGKSLTH